MTRHVRQYCKIANSEDGMGKLFDHATQRQLAIQNEKLSEMKAQMAELAALLKSQRAIAAHPPQPRSEAPIQINPGPVTVNNGPVTNVQTVTQTIMQNITLRPWSGEDRIVIPAALVKEAFTKNARLAEYCRFSDEEKVDAERAVPYVVEALTDLVKRAHATDPATRNVYLNPKRADQVLVFDEATWKVLPLVEAIRSLFDSVAGGLHKIMLTDKERAQLPFEVQATASWIPILYDDQPDEYVKRAKAPLAAHLTNCARTAPSDMNELKH